MIAKKRLLPILVAVLMVFAMMPMSAGTVYAIDPTAEPIADDAYGTTGSCTWRLVSTKDGPVTMCVDAKNGVDGDMDDYAYDNLPPWYKYRDKIEEIEFVGVSTVGAYAFYNCGKLTNVYIFDAKLIGDHAFYGCPALTNITIDGHEEDSCVIEKNAFGESMDYDNKEGSGKIDLANVSYIGDSAFEECDAEVDLGDAVHTIEEYAFAHNCKLEEIMIPRGCIEIGRNAFYDDEKLTKAYVSDATCTIGMLAFEEGVRLFCKKSSPALSYAKENGNDYIVTGNMGLYTLDLRKGDVGFSVSDPEGKAYPLLGGLELMEYVSKIYARMISGKLLIDLDKNGVTDLIYVLPDDTERILMTKDPDCSVKDRITVKLPANIVKEYEDRVPFYSSITVIFDKYANSLKISPKTATVKYSKLKKKNQTLAVTKVIKFTKDAKDKKTYTLVSAKKGSKSFKKYFKISKTTGKVSVKKGLKKGTYKVKVKVKALGNNNYKASGLKSVTFTVKVK